MTEWESELDALVVEQGGPTWDEITSITCESGIVVVILAGRDEPIALRIDKSESRAAGQIAAMVTLSEGALPVKIVAYGEEVTLTASTDEFPTEAITGRVV